MKHSIKLKNDGHIEFVGSLPFDLPLKHIKKRRVSTITPFYAPIKGPAFWILRKLFGEEGCVAAWTRKWRCAWIVKILATGEWSVFEKRDDAVRWELDKLNEDSVDRWL